MVRVRELLARRRRLAIALAALSVLLVAGLSAYLVWEGGRDATMDAVQRSHALRVAMDPSFPPFENVDGSGKPAGFDVDLAQALAARLGVRCDIVPMSFDQILDAVSAGQVDAAVSAMNVVDYRTKEVSFSSPYVEAGLVLAAPPGSPVKNTSDLAGRRLAAEWGSSGDAEARVLQKQLDGKVNLVLRESGQAALDAAGAGEADAVIVDAITLALYHGGKLQQVGPPLHSDPYVVVVPARSPRLLKAINEALAGLDADGTMAALRDKWLR
jgi:ABC-type amino acid transport substrate-binding protein